MAKRKPPRLLINNFPFISKLLTYPSDLIESLNRSGPDPELCSYYTVKLPMAQKMESFFKPSDTLFNALAEQFVKLSWIDEQGNITPATFSELDDKQKMYARSIYNAHIGNEINYPAHEALREKIVDLCQTLFEAGEEDPNEVAWEMFQQGKLTDWKLPKTYDMKAMLFTDTARNKGMELIAARKRFQWKERWF